MKLLAIGVALLSVAASGAPDVAAQPYCAFYNDGTSSCGIPTLQSCDASISGVGGYCGPDQSAQLRPNLIERLEQDNLPPPQLRPNTPQSQQPGGLNWMPPPPQESQ
jgi:hypothetical protein